MESQKVGSAEVGKVLEFDQNPVPMELMVPDVTAADLAILAGWHTEPVIGTNPESSTLELSWQSGPP
ncbi:hypothetical protein [Streptomyces sp. NPDC001315]|uniref:hypothetical protein n=1 Tax=Streptomyces sp. NPDC001315 TaxID=3364562 RepID=UPI0036B6B7CA